MSREEEIVREIKDLEWNLYERKRIRTDWEWLNENRQSLFERYATGDNAAIAFFDKEVFSVGVFTDMGLRSGGVGVMWDFNQRVGPIAPSDYQSINIKDLLRRKTDSPSKILKGYNSSMTEIPEWVDWIDPKVSGKAITAILEREATHKNDAVSLLEQQIIKKADVN